ncbi:hypothetical protein QEG23_002100 [Stenotrophomonas maltophilia]|uniref:Arc family DNA-binding protein n=1 Tax=Stenotrophomonas maltophilia TaxID=40324 RepID=A0AAI9C1S6_STEMA|nr:hypothetical protein [Stenotrophomonas maltophilia]
MKGKKEITPFGLRLAPDLKIWLQHQAVDNRRSLNSEIEHRLAKMRAEEEKGTVA